MTWTCCLCCWLSCVVVLWVKGLLCVKVVHQFITYPSSAKGLKEMRFPYIQAQEGATFLISFSGLYHGVCQVDLPELLAFKQARLRACGAQIKLPGLYGNEIGAASLGCKYPLRASTWAPVPADVINGVADVTDALQSAGFDQGGPPVIFIDSSNREFPVIWLFASSRLL